MKKILSLLIFLAVFSSSSFAQIVFDTIAQYPVGPGAEYIRIEAPQVPWTLCVLKVKLNNPYIKLETCIANEKLFSQKEKTSSMSVRRNYNKHWTVGAVNADFFNPDGSPVNIQVEQGELVRTDNAGYPAIAFTALMKMFMGNPTTSVIVKTKTNLVTVNGINTARGANQINFYNRFAGASTSTDSAGTELLIRNITPWYMNDTVICIIDSIIINRGNMTIPSGLAVLSAGIAAAPQFAAVVKGDTIKMIFNAFSGLRKINEMIGGHPVIIKNGQKVALDSTSSFNITRHPRTGIGLSADSTTLFLITVDGRQVISKGMDLFEFADFMLKLGIYQGMNFDGGGSTTMVVRNEIMNSPSDPGGERAVANSLLVISTAPLTAVAHVALKPASLRIFAGSTYTFSTSATDSFYNPITLNPALLSYRVSKPSLGTITSAGLFTAGNQTDTGYVIVTYGGIKDSAKITIKTVGYVKVNPSVVVTDHRLIVPFKLHIYDVDSMEVTVPENLVSWKCSDSTVGFIDDFGQFSGVEEGTAKIIGKYSNWRDTARVSVEIGRGKKVLDSLERLDQWSLAGQNYDSIATQLLLSNQYATLGLNSFNLDYHFIYQTGMYNWLFLKDSIRIYGIPDSICVDLRSDGAGHRLFWDFTDAQNQNVRVTCNKIASAVNTFERFAGTFPLLTSIVYPLTLKSITFALGSTRVQGQQYQGNIYIDNLRIVYPLSSSTGMEFRPPNKPGTFRLFHNYPNPCNPRTTVSVQLPEPAKVTLRLYSIIGKEVLSQEFTYAHAGNYRIDLDLSQFASGPYFYRVNFKGMTQQSEAVQKIMLLK